MDELKAQIMKGCETIVKESQPFANATPVSHRSKAFLQFNGGILGAVQEYREDKRLVKLINAPISDRWSFYTFAFHIIEETETLVNKVCELQKLLPHDSDEYLKEVQLVISAIEQAKSNWLHYSPDMAVEGIKIGDQDNVSLGMSVDSLTRESFLKMDMPEEMKNSIKPKEEKNSGCLGLLIALIIPIPIIRLLLL